MYSIVFLEVVCASLVVVLWRPLSQIRSFSDARTPAEEMNDPCLWPIEDSPSLGPRPSAIVNILEVHEEALIEQSDLVDDFFADNNAGKANPLRLKGLVARFNNDIKLTQQ